MLLPRTNLQFVVLLLASSLGASPLFAQQPPLPLGLERLVNVSQLADQDEAASALGPSGDVVVVWRDSIIDGGPSAIMARRFDGGSGMPLTGEIHVSVSLGDQRNPAVAVGADGRFVVVWEGPEPQAPLSLGVFGSLRAADGTPIVAEFPIAVGAVADQRRPTVAMHADGKFFVGWQSAGTGESTVHGRIYPATFPVDSPGAPFPLAQQSSGDRESPTVAPDPSTGGWFAAWQGLFGTVASILVRRLDADGEGSPEVAVNSSTTLVDRRSPALAVRADGNSVALWQEPDADGEGIWGRLVRGISPVDDQFSVNIEVAGDQIEPSVWFDTDANVIAVWTSIPGPALGVGSGDLLGSPIVIKGRKKGTAVAGFAAGAGTEFSSRTGEDAEFLVNSAGDDVGSPGVVALPAGTIVATWAASGGLFDLFGQGVYLRRFGIGLFLDGFESGDTSEWSDVGR